MTTLTDKAILSGADNRPAMLEKELKYTFACGGEIESSDLGHTSAGRFTHDVYVLDTEKLVWKLVEDGSGGVDHPGPHGWCAFSSGKRDGKEGL
uniref:Nitrile-specifier protein 5-like n=1 Tax=Tanacetum cinerariifolium TaxID=118510 RepID=A0A6L2P2L7_TANCI|nr:nitrile-specifier protein 5-like [Tanacetum cinerariifolium]